MLLDCQGPEGDTCRVQGYLLQAARNGDTRAHNALAQLFARSNEAAKLSTECEDEAHALGQHFAADSAVKAALEDLNLRGKPTTTNLDTSSYTDEWSSGYDPEGSLLLDCLANAIKASGPFEGSGIGHWVDASFPPRFSSIAIKGQGLPKALETRIITWRRPEQLGDPEHTPRLFAGAIEANDLNQGLLGDCYILAALAGLASTSSGNLEGLIDYRHADIGLYGVKLFVQGRWITIPVDDYFPAMGVHPFGEAASDESVWWVPCFSRFSRSDIKRGFKEFWPMMIEKAFAKHFGCYSALEGGKLGDVLQYLTGGLISTLNFDMRDPNSSPDTSWTRLQKILNNSSPSSARATRIVGTGQLVAALNFNKFSGGMEEATAKGLFGGHAYTVLNLLEVGSTRLLRLRNPWGIGEWSGRFCRSDSASWEREPLVKQEAERITGAALYQNTQEEKGVFWMTFEDFMEWFTVEVCDSARVEPTCTTIRSHWIAGLTCGGRLEGTESWKWSGWGQFGAFIANATPQPLQKLGSSFKFNPRFLLRLQLTSIPTLEHLIRFGAGSRRAAVCT